MAEKKSRVRFLQYTPPYVTGDIAMFPEEKCAELVERGLVVRLKDGSDKPKAKRGRPPKAASAPNPAAASSDEAAGEQ